MNRVANDQPAPAGDATGGAAAPLPTPARYDRAWLATAYNALSPLKGTAFSARYSGYFPESIRNTLPPSAPRDSTESSAARASNPGTITARHRAKPDLPTPAMLPTARRFPLATESPI
jgi:hypothetical protein